MSRKAGIPAGDHILGVRATTSGEAGVDVSLKLRLRVLGSGLFVLFRDGFSSVGIKPRGGSEDRLPVVAQLIE